MEEEYIHQLCEDIIQLKPDVVITEKGISGRGPSVLKPAAEVEEGEWWGLVLSLGLAKTAM